MSSTGSMPREVAPWIERLARLGYAAKALLYGTIGLLAAKAAFGPRGKVTDTQGALRTVEGNFGDAFVILIAIGLFGYGAWRLVEAALDPERRGSDLKALAVRFGLAFRGLVHGALGVTALRLAIGQGGGKTGNQAKEWTTRGLELPGGEMLVAAAGLAIAGYGLYQLYRAWAAKLGRQLRLGQMSEPLRGWVVGVSRFGIAARGVVFCLIGFFLARSGLKHDPAEAGGLRESLHTLAGVGRWPFAAVAIGLVAYGVYELLNARYRRIEVSGE
ncbi:MAG TPA: DUF1206 domain-containing protein [Gemmatimonadales bacterium]|nr:DUF1206 domain-containing protein [Gemmatimonadales bacterium]